MDPGAIPVDCRADVRTHIAMIAFLPAFRSLRGWVLTADTRFEEAAAAASEGAKQIE
jgi:hypothetical protein